MQRGTANARAESDVPIDERILSAAKEDNEEVYEDAIKEAHDINHQDGSVDSGPHGACNEWARGLQCWSSRIVLGILVSQ